MIIIIAIVVLVAALIGVLLFQKNKGPAQGSNTPTEPQTVNQQYTVTVKTDDDSPVPGVAVYVYKGSTDGEMIHFGNTDETGATAFTAPKSDDLLAVLENIPTGYSAEASYPITGENTEITPVSYTHLTLPTIYSV